MDLLPSFTNVSEKSNEEVKIKQRQRKLSCRMSELGKEGERDKEKEKPQFHLRLYYLNDAIN